MELNERQQNILDILREKGKITRDMLDIDSRYEACPKNCIPVLLDAVADPKYYVPDELVAVLDIWEEFQDNLFKKAESLAKNCKTQREFSRKIAKYEAKYSYMRELNFIFSVPEYMMGSENYKKLQSMQEKYSKKSEEISSLIEGKPEGKVGRGYDSADSAYTSPAEAPAVEYVEPADSAAEEAPRSRVQLL